MTESDPPPRKLRFTKDEGTDASSIAGRERSLTEPVKNENPAAPESLTFVKEPKVIEALQQDPIEPTRPPMKRRLSFHTPTRRDLGR